MTEQKPAPQLIDLQSAHVTQHTNDGIKTDWKIRKNITSEDIFALPMRLHETEVFSIMDFVKKYELIAFNAGIKFQKGKQNELLVSKIKELELLVGEFATENERLSTILEQRLPKEV